MTKQSHSSVGSYQQNYLFRQHIRELFNKSFRTPFNPRQVAHKVGAKNEMQKRQVAEWLETLTDEGFLIKESRSRYRRNTADMLLTGIFVRTHNRSSIEPDNGSAPIFVSECNARHALSGDKVEYLLIDHGKYSGEAEITDIIERRGQQQVVGTVEKIGRKEAILRTDNRIFDYRIEVPVTLLHEAQEGEKVVVRLTDWPNYEDSPRGEVVTILGRSGENDTEMHAILAEFGLPTHYPEDLEKLADQISDRISEEEISCREDFRNVTTFTIDPADAKDFDDALSLRKLPGGNWEVGVHIADVTYYVKPGSPIDKEAYERGTSVYLVDRTVPMLPERLCNQICSLRPNEEKLCFSAVFELDDNAHVQKSRIGRTIIRSDRRYTYEEAQQVIETGEGDFANELLTLNRLAVALRKERFAHGAIDFDRQEMKFIIDEKGRPLGVYTKVSKEANKLIEEFMLLANRTVAESIGRVPKNSKPKTFVYRVHDNPDPEKMATLSEFVKKLGLKLRATGTRNEITDSINGMLAQIHNTPEENLISTLTIRTMAKAEYTTQNIGHYGLAFDFYTHFTSPIRRYPDMMVHRLLEHYQNHGRSLDANILEEKCKHASDMEQLAANAERASIKYKQAEFLSERIGQTYDGIISGLAERGVYVEIDDNKCEGLIPMRDLDDDYYEFDEKNYRLVGRHSRRQYQLGDPVRIVIARVDMERRQIDFALEGSQTFRPKERSDSPTRKHQNTKGMLSPKAFGLKKARHKRHK